MSHLEPERLVLLALGEGSLDQRETGHLDTCDECRAEMDELRDVAGIARQTQRLRDLPPPPEHVWHRIRTELAASNGATPPPAVTLHTDPPASRPAFAADVPVSLADRRQRRKRRAPGWAATIAIAAAAAAVAASGTFWLARSPEPTVVSCGAGQQRVTLGALPGAPSGVGGYACLVEVGGERKLVVHAEGMPNQADGDYEAWLLDSTSLQSAALRMQALGVMGGKGDQALTVPGALNLQHFNIVDISVEPHDGNAAHSGKSVLRGVLPA